MDQTTNLSRTDRRQAIERLAAFRDAIDRRRARGGEAVLPSRIRPRVSRRHLRANPRADAGGDRLPPDARPQQGPRSHRRHAYAREDRPVPGIHPQPAAGEARAVGRGRPRALLGAGQAGLHPPSRARPVEAFRRRLRQGRHVSDPDPHPRHPRLSDHAAHRHASGRGSRSSFICRRTTPTPTSAPSSTRSSPTVRCRRRRRCALRPTPATPSRSAPTPGTRRTRCTIASSRAIRSCSPISSTRACCEVFRNRGKRVGNFVLNEIRQYVPV